MEDSCNRLLFESRTALVSMAPCATAPSLSHSSAWVAEAEAEAAAGVDDAQRSMKAEQARAQTLSVQRSMRQTNSSA